MEFLNSNQLLFQLYQPKQQHLFYLLILDGFPAFLIKASGRPSRKTNLVSYDNINMKRYIAGKTLFDPLSITLIDAIIPSAALAVQDWLRLQFDPTTGRCGYAAQYKKNITLKLLGPAGDVVLLWICYGTWLSSVDNGSLDWSSDDILNIECTLRYDIAIQVQ